MNDWKICSTLERLNSLINDFQMRKETNEFEECKNMQNHDISNFASEKLWNSFKIDENFNEKKENMPMN